MVKHVEELLMNPSEIEDFEDCYGRLRSLATTTEYCPYFLPDTKKETLKSSVSLIRDALGRASITLTSHMERTKDNRYTKSAIIGMLHPTYGDMSMKSIPNKLDTWRVRDPGRGYSVSTNDALVLVSTAIEGNTPACNTLLDYLKIASPANFIDALRLDLKSEPDRLLQHSEQTIYKLPEDAHGVRRQLSIVRDYINGDQRYHLSTTANYLTDEGNITATISHFSNNNRRPPANTITLSSPTANARYLEALARCEKRTGNSLVPLLTALTMFEKQIKTNRSVLAGR